MWLLLREDTTPDTGVLVPWKHEIEHACMHTGPGQQAASLCSQHNNTEKQDPHVQSCCGKHALLSTQTHVTART